MTEHGEHLEPLRTNIPCQWACPALTRVPDYIHAIHRGDFVAAEAINRADILLPGVLGRICSRPCEAACRHGEDGLGEPVAICHLKRAAADGAVDAAPAAGPEEAVAETGKRVAVVGAGPAGLAAAYHLRRFGHRVTLFEAREKPGGMLAYGIPAFRLPPQVLEREMAAALGGAIGDGLELRCGVRVGVDVALAELQEAHDAVVLGVGCQGSRKLDVPGATLDGCLDGLAFVVAANAGRAPRIGKRVDVVGGGFTAIDCARLAVRLGAEDVRLVYRRERGDMPLRAEDLDQTLAEGVTLVERRLPTAFEEGTTKGELGAARWARTRVVSGARAGRRVAETVAGSEASRPVDTVIVAIGQRVDEDFRGDGAAVEVVDTATGRTRWDDVFVAGDLALGPTSVVEAIGHATRVARAVDLLLMGRERARLVVRTVPAENTVRERAWDEIPRQHASELPPDLRRTDATAEVETGYPADARAAEARRCYLCHLVYAVDEPRCIFCDKCIEVCPRACIHLTLDGERVDVTGGWKQRLRFWRRPKRGLVIDPGPCIRCGLCVEVCPTSCIDVTRLELSEEVRA